MSERGPEIEATVSCNLILEVISHYFCHVLQSLWEGMIIPLLSSAHFSVSFCILQLGFCFCLSHWSVHPSRAGILAHSSLSPQCQPSTVGWIELRAWGPPGLSLGEIIKSRGFWNQVQILGSLIISCVTLSKLHNLSQRQFPEL